MANCFCHFNGYEVKDATARKSVEDLKSRNTVLEARMNTFTALPEGSTAGDAELADLRIAYNGRSFPSAGAAVRAADAEINGRVFPIWKSGEKTKINHTSVADGYYITGSGAVEVLSWTQVYTVPVEPNVTYLCEKVYNGINNCWIAFYDKDGNFISGVKNTDPNAETYTVDLTAAAPENAVLLKYTTKADNAHGVYTFTPWNVSKLYSDMQNIKLNIWKQGIKKKMEPDSIENDKYIKSDGSIEYLSGYEVLTYVVEANTYYEIENASTGSPNWYVAFYNAAGTLLGGKRHSSDIGYYFTGTVFAPENAVVMKVEQGAGEAIAYSRTNEGSKELSGKKWAAIGDSITEKNLRATSGYCDYIAEATGIEAYNMGISGTGYASSRSESGNAFHHRAAAIPSDCDVVTIFGGGNDIALTDLPLGNDTDTGTETLCGCFNTTINNIFAAHPLIKLGIITPCPWKRYPLTEPGNELERFVDAMIRICKARGIPVLDLYRCSGLRPWDAAFRAAAYSRDDGDGTHPDENGHKYIASHVKEFIKTLII